jgi:hypothetical protein
VVVIFDAAAEVAKIYAAKGVPTTNMPPVKIDYVLADPNQSGLIYVALDVPGLPVIFMSENAKATTPTWTNITLNLPHTYHWMPSIHPVTGELFMNSSMGEFVLPAPDCYPALPNKNYFTNWMDQFYARPDVPEPPLLAADSITICKGITTSDKEVDPDKNSDIRVYPNPANDNIFIEGTVTSSGKLQLDLINIMGQNIMSREVEVNDTFIEKLSLADIPAGIYFITILTENEKSVVKVIKQ